MVGIPLRIKVVRIISAWTILLFVQQYRALLTASECESDSRRFTLFCVRFDGGLLAGLALTLDVFSAPLVCDVSYAYHHAHDTVG